MHTQENYLYKLWMLPPLHPPHIDPYDLPELFVFRIYVVCVLRVPFVLDVGGEGGGEEQKEYPGQTLSHLDHLFEK